MATEKEAEEAGYDAAVTGPNTTNCNFALFAKPELTRAWERGNERGKTALANWAAQKKSI